MSEGLNFYHDRTMASRQSIAIIIAVSLGCGMAFAFISSSSLSTKYIAQPKVTTTIHPRWFGINQINPKHTLKHMPPQQLEIERGPIRHISQHATAFQAGSEKTSSWIAMGVLFFTAVASIALQLWRHKKQSSPQYAGWQMLSVAGTSPEKAEEPKSVSSISSMLSLIRLAFVELQLRWYKSQNPDVPLYTLPSRKVISNESDIYAVASRLPAKYQDLFRGWFAMYKQQVMSGGATEEKVYEVFNQIVDRLILLNKEPYVFESAHRMIRQPFDYFEFGQAYTGLLVDFNRSYLRNLEKWDDIAQAIKKGENVILLGNHQSESDAAFIPLLLETYNKNLGEMVIYVAGDRVVSDPMVQPFSMGRNLFCVHSKKHMDDDPRMSREEKQKMNRKTLVEMSKAFKKGGNLVWIAPSGGRDRRNKDGEWAPSEFDVDAVELMRALGAKSGRNTWLYPFSMATNAVMPPPETRASGDLGEKRITNFTGVALSLADPLLASGQGWLPEGVELGSDEAKQYLTGRIFKAVNEEYDLIKYVMKGFGDGTYVVPNGSQPWKTGLKSPYQL